MAKIKNSKKKSKFVSEKFSEQALFPEEQDY